jgi:uncharacterized protein YndB with AHSA1/START domain
MKKKLILEKTVELNSHASKVWDALTNPVLIKQYLFGSDAISDWKEGSPLYFKGVWEGKEYMDKGTILKVKPNELFQYNYWSSFSGTADIPQNYAIVTYQLTTTNGHTKLVVIQDNFATEEARKHFEQNWGFVLDGIKKIVEA